MAENNKNFKPTDTSSIDTDIFVKGMVKDSHESFVGKENWTHCRNCINNSAKGDAGTIGNEPANLICAVTGYTIIGAIYLYGDKWIIFSTNNVDSEIGLFDDSECKYDTLINDQCLNFHKSSLITGASKENYDCTWHIYWDDGRNPSRTINLGATHEFTENNYIPWLQEQITGPDIDGSDCIYHVDIEPLQLNCDLIRLAPLMKTPNIKLLKAKSPGQLPNGSYQAYIAYTINEQQIGDYIGVSNVQPLFDNAGTACSLDIEIENLDTNFDFYKLVILSNNQQQPEAVQIGFYSTEQKTINIDYIAKNKAASSQVPLQNLVIQNPSYEMSDKMMPVNDYLLRIGPRTNFDFNYQPLANNITSRWVSVEYPAEYYKNGGNNPTFMRDEQYAFFIRFIYTTGEKSNSYHIPGREAMVSHPDIGDELNTSNTNGNNILNEEETAPWQVINTAFVEEYDGVTVLPDGGRILSKGKMGYWESTERYPAKDPHQRWGDLCGKPIRHHKFPEEQTDDTVDRSNSNNQYLRVLGVEFDNISWPLDIEGNPIPNITGYEILVGSREGNKSILSKGILRNMKQYPLPEANVGGGSGADNPDFIAGTVGVMPNYPYNDLNADVFLTEAEPQQLGNSEPPSQGGGLAVCGASPYSYTCNNFYTFHSPETSFQRPFLNPSEVKSYGFTTGLSSGFFRPSEGHPKHVLIRDFTAILAMVIGIGYAISKMRGKRKTSVQANSLIPGPLTAYNAALQVPETAFTMGSAFTPGLSEFTYQESTSVMLDAAATANNLVYLPPLGQGNLAGNTKVEFEGTDVKSLPNLVSVISGIFMSMHYAAVGGQEVVDLVYNIAGLTQYAWKYNSYGLYSTTIARQDADVYRNNITKARYIGNTMQDFGSEGIIYAARINNLNRPATVGIQTNGTFGNQFEPLSTYYGYDSSRQTLGSTNLHGKPTTKIISAIGAHYVGLKFAMDNQYGQLDGIKQVPIPRNQMFLNTDNEPVNVVDLQPNDVFKTEVLFGGDAYINRYSEKVIMPFFWEFLNGQPDKFGFDYRDYMNVPYPKYWMDTNKYDMHNLFAPIFDFSFSWSAGDAIPSAMRQMDRPGNYIYGGGMSWTADPGDTTSYGDSNSLFVLREAFMYTHCSGVNDFFVESELNIGLRSQGNSTEQKFYDWTEYTDLNALFHSDIIDKGNYYKYDFSLSKNNLVSQLITYASIQPRDYDPKVADTCYDHYTKRIIYSNQAHKEAKKDFWRVYLPNNYQDFKNVPTTVKPISKSGAIILFPHLAPQLFQGVDTLTTDFNTKLTIGDGGLFNEPMQQISTADLPHEYGSCENSRSVINTPAGLFYISQAQGKIFNYADGLTNIADAGMKQWFNTYLPSRLLKQFPEMEGTRWADNTVAGIGCTAVYDPNYDIVYFSKIDYDVCNDCIEFDEELGFVINETECYGVPPIEVVEVSCTPPYVDNGEGECCLQTFEVPEYGTEEVIPEGQEEVPDIIFNNPDLLFNVIWPIYSDNFGIGVAPDQWSAIGTPDILPGYMNAPCFKYPTIAQTGLFGTDDIEGPDGYEQPTPTSDYSTSGVYSPIQWYRWPIFNITDAPTQPNNTPYLQMQWQDTGTFGDTFWEYDNTYTFGRGNPGNPYYDEEGNVWNYSELEAQYGNGMSPSAEGFSHNGGKYVHLGAWAVGWYIASGDPEHPVSSMAPGVFGTANEGITQWIPDPVVPGVTYSGNIVARGTHGSWSAGGCFEGWKRKFACSYSGTTCTETGSPDYDYQFGGFFTNDTIEQVGYNPGGSLTALWNENHEWVIDWDAYPLGDVWQAGGANIDTQAPQMFESPNTGCDYAAGEGSGQNDGAYVVYKEGDENNNPCNGVSPAYCCGGNDSGQCWPANKQSSWDRPVGLRIFGFYSAGPYAPTEEYLEEMGFFADEFVQEGGVIGMWTNMSQSSWSSNAVYDLDNPNPDGTALPYPILSGVNMGIGRDSCEECGDIEYNGSFQLLWDSGSLDDYGDRHMWRKIPFEFTPNQEFNQLLIISYTYIDDHDTYNFCRPQPGGVLIDKISNVIPQVEYEHYCNCSEGNSMVFDDGIYQTPATPEDCINYYIHGSGDPVICMEEDCIEPTEEETSQDVLTPIPLECGENFDCIHWTASYDPKAKAWISFHDWHPELSISSHNHFMTTKTLASVDPYCPPGTEFNEETQLCEPIGCPEGYEYAEDGITCCQTFIEDTIISPITDEETEFDPYLECDPSFVDGYVMGVINPSFQMGMIDWDYLAAPENTKIGGHYYFQFAHNNQEFDWNTSLIPDNCGLWESGEELLEAAQSRNSPGMQDYTPTPWTKCPQWQAEDFYYDDSLPTVYQVANNAEYADYEGPTEDNGQIFGLNNMQELIEHSFWDNREQAFCISADTLPTRGFRNNFGAPGIALEDAVQPSNPPGANYSPSYTTYPETLNNHGMDPFFNAHGESWMQDISAPNNDDPSVPTLDGSNTFIGLVHDLNKRVTPNYNHQEGVSQELCGSMIEGQYYEGSIDIASLGGLIMGSTIPPNPTNYEYGGRIMIFGGMSQCSYEQRLWISPHIEPGSNWQTYTYSYTAEQAWTHIHIKVQIEASGKFVPPGDYNHPNYRQLMGYRAGGPLLPNCTDPDTGAEYCGFNGGPSYYNSTTQEYQDDPVWFSSLDGEGWTCAVCNPNIQGTNWVTATGYYDDILDGVRCYLMIDNLVGPFYPDFEVEEPEIQYTCNCPDESYTMVINDGIYETPASIEDCLNPDLDVICIKEDCIVPEPIEPEYDSGAIWKHNVRCDLFNNYYEVQYPWEIELIESVGQSVNTIRSIEYQLESYLYQPKYDDDGCILNYGCDDRWHDLMYNFDEAIIYNSEQVSGLLTLVEQTPDINDILSYPRIGDADIEILFRKVEQKYRFDQFWDITSDRNIPEPIFITQLNGYIRDLNASYMNYNKEELERKKFRHYANRLILRKKLVYNEANETVLHTRKMLLKLVNTKINLSIR